MNIKQAVPFFAVSDMESSLRFYVDGLGFRVANKWVDAGTMRWCWLSREGAGLMLQDFRRDGGRIWKPEGTLGLGVSIMFICANAPEIYAEVTSRGIAATTPVVANGMWVTSLKDPDGYRVAFESPTDVPEDTQYDARRRSG